MVCFVGSFPNVLFISQPSTQYPDYAFIYLFIYIIATSMETSYPV